MLCLNIPVLQQKLWLRFFDWIKQMNSTYVHHAYIMIAYRKYWQHVIEPIPSQLQIFEKQSSTNQLPPVDNVKGVPNGYRSSHQQQYSPPQHANASPVVTPTNHGGGLPLRQVYQGSPQQQGQLQGIPQHSYPPPSQKGPKKFNGWVNCFNYWELSIFMTRGLFYSHVSFRHENQTLTIERSPLTRWGVHYMYHYQLFRAVWRIGKLFFALIKKFPE